MNSYRYPVSALRGDYIRAGIGTVFMGSLLYGASAVPVIFVIVSALFLLFFGFGLQTWSRHMTMFELHPEGLQIFGLRRRQIDWDDISTVKLRFFSVKKDRDSGWMELTLQTDAGKVKIDSGLEGFNEIATAVAKGVEERGLSIDETSVENFQALGIETRSPGLPEAAKRFDGKKTYEEDL